jgi:hypothetical protein
MTKEEFVRSFKAQKDQMLQLYFSESLEKTESTISTVGAHIRSMRLSAEQTQTMRKALDGALTDAFYNVLLALDGCARIGDLEQQSFEIHAEDSSEVCNGDGEIEALAYKYFHA